ncbi:unnamed protein product [Pleuronectes platessa]|uniref:Uncharacterized protein n=1 Tax=Pleuronectes platessa TaxID=8262 RepID=A0A9N7VY73_PLEPL|nr:unnamed protein product [Pleuronectes platessa]
MPSKDAQEDSLKQHGTVKSMVGMVEQWFTLLSRGRKTRLSPLCFSLRARGLFGGLLAAQAMPSRKSSLARLPACLVHALQHSPGIRGRRLCLLALVPSRSLLPRH